MNVVHFYGFNFLSLHSSKWSEVLARPGRVGTSRERRAGGHAGLCSARRALSLCAVCTLLPRWRSSTCPHQTSATRRERIM